MRTSRSATCFFVTLRVFLASAAFFVVMALFGAGRRRGPRCSPSRRRVLTGLAFATPITAFSISRETEHGLSAMFRFVIMPMFLFSGHVLPGDAAARPPSAGSRTSRRSGTASSLCRGLALGELSPLGALGHTVVLVAYLLVGGLLVAITFYRRRLAA